MSKLSNVILLLRLLQKGRKYSIKELANKLEVSPRMIREYKNELECADIFIESMRGPYGGYYLNQDIKIPENIICLVRLLIIGINVIWNIILKNMII